MKKLRHCHPVLTTYGQRLKIPKMAWTCQRE